MILPILKTIGRRHRGVVWSSGMDSRCCRNSHGSVRSGSDGAAGHRPEPAEPQKRRGKLARWLSSQPCPLSILTRAQPELLVVRAPRVIFWRL